jgi:diguanylate cyclase (GGDEF)-like protein
MLSETTQAGPSGPFLLFRQVVYSRAQSAKLAGTAASVVSLLAIGAAMLVAPPEIPVALLLVLPVAGAGWFGGAWAARSVAAAGAFVPVGAAAVAGGSVDSATIAGSLMALAVLLLVAGAMPGLRFAAQSYREHAQVDPLTNLGNRRFFREVAAVELNRSKRYTRPVSLISLNAEGFERLRLTIGGAECDLMLVQMASVMTGTLRTSDVVARISGAEFAILLPETDGAGAKVVAEKLRRRLTETASSAGHPLSFRASVVGYGDGPVSADAMFRQADEAMVRSRQSADEVVMYRDYEHPPLQLV